VTLADYRQTRRAQMITSAHETLAAQAKENAFAVSRAQAEAKAREEEAIRLAAQQRAAEQAKREQMVLSLNTGKALAQRAAQRSTLYTRRTLDNTRDLLSQLRAFTPAAQAVSTGTGFEASPEGMTFYPAK